MLPLRYSVLELQEGMGGSANQILYGGRTMTRALSIPPDAAARMMMLVSHDKKSQRITPQQATRDLAGESTTHSKDDVARGDDLLATTAGSRRTEA
jgi:hypothetical protein